MDSLMTPFNLVLYGKPRADAQVDKLSTSARVFVALIILMVLSLLFDLVRSLNNKLMGKSGYSTGNNLANFTRKFVDSSTLSNKDGFSRDPVSAGSSVAWPPSPELLEANAMTASAWGRETLKWYDPDEGKAPAAPPA